MSGWLWFWIALATLFGIGEVLTRGLYLIPFALAAALAGGMAYAGVATPIQWGAYAVTSVVLLFVANHIAKRLARRD